MGLVDFQPPYWVDGFKENDDAHKDGHLFRHSYPLRIGVGCSMNCSYCTIRVTRGKLYRIEADKAEKEFADHDNIVLVSDSPTAAQIKEWAELAIKYNKPISIRNIEPHVAMSVFEVIFDLADRKLLKEFHCPVQHTNVEVLKDMRRNVEATLQFMAVAPLLKKLGVFLATNVIIDYKDFENPDMKVLNRIFDYVSWNVYWDGKFDFEKAKEKFYKYFPWSENQL
jgi:tRNA A37 methylthiotransferase MiaB